MEMNTDSEVGLRRLREEQEKSLNACLERIEQWEKFEADYNSLHSFLGTVGDKLTHDIMVPFGSLAFMPGKLINTNNVLALLGDNWFVERSTKEAQGIVERRLQSCKDTLRNLEKEKQQAQEWIKHTKSAAGEEGIKEIIEEYDPVKDTSWKGKHRDEQGKVSRVARSGKSTRLRWEDQEHPKPNVITFTHSDKAPPDSLEFDEESKTPQSVTSPGDIWHVFGPPVTERKSILKTTTKTQSASDKPSVNIKPKARIDSNQQAFTGEIVEKECEFVEPIKDVTNRPVSRFKAQRAKNK